MVGLNALTRARLQLAQNTFLHPFRLAGRACPARASGGSRHPFPDGARRAPRPALDQDR